MEHNNGLNQEIKLILNQNPFKQLADSIRFDVTLKNITWLRCGGNATALFRPKNLKELQLFLANFPLKDKIYILGSCSNVLIRDGGIDGVVIKLAKGFNKIDLKPHNNLKDLVEFNAGGAILDIQIVNFCVENSITGLEFLCGIPGTLGGNIRMNAGCYSNEISKVMKEFCAVDLDGKFYRFKSSDIDFTYRNNPLPKNLIFTEAVLFGKIGNQEQIRQTIRNIQEQRQKTQPVKLRTSGSTFVNPEGYQAWKLIDDCGLRGFSLGDAQISELHTNFLINKGNATATELEKVAETARLKVKEKFNLDLQWEVQRLGKPS